VVGESMKKLRNIFEDDDSYCHENLLLAKGLERLNLDNASEVFEMV
jgi:hypothetical protein